MTHIFQAIRTVDARQTGGPEEQLLLACPLLLARGRVRPRILLLRKPAPGADPATDFASRARAGNIPVTALQDIRFTPGWLGGLPGRSGVRLIHMHGQRANYFVWLLRRLFPHAWGRLPLVATVHGWVADNWIRRVVTRLEWITLRDCTLVLTVSEQQRQTLLGRGHQPERVRVVRPGIPLLTAGHAPASAEERARARARWHLPPTGYVVTAVGRLSSEKRFDLYIEAVAQLVPRLPGAIFLLVGGGKREAALKAQAAALGLGDERLRFTGLTRDMAGIYAATDALVLTSDTEGTPHVLLEAMGSDIPIISTAVGGIPEFVTDGENGLLVPPGDAPAIAGAIRRLHDDPALAARLVAGGRRTAAEFTIERLVANLEDAYRFALEHARAG